MYLDQIEGVSGSKRERERESGVKDDFETSSRSGLTERERERASERERERQRERERERYLSRERESESFSS